MNARRQHDFDDGFDEASLFEDEEYRFELRRKRASRSTPANSRRSPHDREDRFRDDSASRRDRESRRK